MPCPSPLSGQVSLKEVPISSAQLARHHPQTRNQNESKRLLISQDFLPQSVTTKRLRRTLRNKGFSKASVTTHRRQRAASRLPFQLVGRGRQRERDGDGGELHHFSPFASPRSSSRVFSHAAMRFGSAAACTPRRCSIDPRGTNFFQLGVGRAYVDGTPSTSTS